MSKRTRGQLLLDDFLAKLDKSLTIIKEKNTINLDELRPAWEAREKLESYLATPQRDNKGKFLPRDNDHIPDSGKMVDHQGQL